MRKLVLAALVAFLCFGGTFTCHCESDDDDEIHGFVNT